MSAAQRRRFQFAGFILFAAALALAAVPVACQSPAPHARAERIVNRTQLIGGPDALGDVGDLKLSNGKVRFVIQGITAKSNFSRGWGVYGGSLLDADLQRPAAASSAFPTGNDHFGELFPAFFLEAISPSSVEIGSTGADGGPASIVVTGTGAPFLTLARQLLGFSGLDTSADPNADGLVLTNTYSLGPTDQYLKITTTIAPPASATASLKVSNASLLGINIAIPFGSVALFGNQNEVFIPGVGFDVRYGLEDAYAKPSKLPALSGLVTDLIATRADGVSYGLAVEPPAQDALNTSYTYKNQQYFQVPTDAPAENKMLIPFVASSFTGVFTAQAPDEIPVGGSFSYTTYFFVGQGDVGSVRDVYYDARKTVTGTITALIREEGTNQVVPGTSLIVLKDGKPFSQYHVNSEGRAIGRLEPGSYSAVVACDERDRLPPVPFTVVAGKSTEIAGGSPTMSHVLAVPKNALVAVTIVEAPDSLHPNQPLPAKVTLVGTSPSDATHNGLPVRKFLYNLPYGDRMLPSDLVADLPDVMDPADPTKVLVDNANTRRYVERVILSDGTGVASGQIRAGTYDVLVSRGPEYEVADLGNVTFAPGDVKSFGAVLKRVVDTKNFISADFHVHSNNSIDGHISLNDRVLSYAAEGVEILTSTDHNVVTDYRPNVAALKLQNYMRSMVGLEMTTLEMGHFNAFPLNFEQGDITHGAFDWVNLAPDALFQALRAPPLGMADGSTVVEVNHPRDTILGYYHQFNVSQDLAWPTTGSLLTSANGPAFGTASQSSMSWNYDAMEVFNGKRFELLHTFRMPSSRPDNFPNIPADVPAGAVIRLSCKTGTTCTDDLYAANGIAFPGSIEDWFALLNQAGQSTDTVQAAAKIKNGQAMDLIANPATIPPITATGNSDSHGLYFEEAGYPRNWVQVNKDEPRNVTDREIAASVHNHRVMLSNGPFIELSAEAVDTGKTAGIGELLTTGSDTVKLHIKVSAAPWLALDRITVYTNANADIRSPAPTPITVSTPRAQVVRYSNDGYMLTLPSPGKDSWIVVMAEGDASMFPIVTPLEQPPLAISDAVASIAGPLGFGDDGMKDLRPPTVNATRPFAMTNPIWIDRDGDGLSFGRTATNVTFPEPGQSALVSANTRIPLPAKPAPVIDDKTRYSRSSDLSKIFRAWGHGHSH
jgi:hypothetical protein